MTEKQTKNKFTKGNLFRIVGPDGVSPEVWIWDGEQITIRGKPYYFCRRLYDNFSMALPSESLILLDLSETN